VVERSPAYVIERVLEEGGPAAIRWLRRRYGDAAIGGVVRRSRRLTRRTAEAGRRAPPPRSVELARTAEGTLAGVLDGVRVALFHYPYPLLEEPARFEGIRIAQPRDLGAMKLSAIAQRGARRDFIDLYWVLTRSHPLDELLAAYTRKLGASERAIPHLLRSLAWFDDAEAEPMPRLLVAADWNEIKRRLAAEAERVSRLLF
jgi:hypothetical protein